MNLKLKKIVVKRHWGKLDINYTSELLLIFLGVIMILWLCRGNVIILKRCMLK